MTTVAFIIPNDFIPAILDHGTHNGYVAVPPENKYHGKHYDEVSNVISVHGGLTFSRQACEYAEAMRLYNAEYLTEGAKIGADWWIFGFDTGHAFDNSRDQNREYVIAETLSLQQQLEEE